MKISYNWLKNYLNTDLPASEVSDILTNIGLEVEGLEEFQSVRGGLEGVVVGEVLERRAHENADKLSVCMVDVGEGDPVQIVCGAPNVRKGQKVAVAKVGCTLYPDEEGIAIKKAKIRGEVSMGMICAEDELGLGSSHEGIMVLDQRAAAGTPAADYFNIDRDQIFEIGLTPNRIDAASHLGVARDLAAYLNQEKECKVNRPSVKAFRVDNQWLEMDVIVEESEGCKRYSGLTISGVKVEESPDWLKTRLRSIGQTPINNIVDITNFVLHECGQPLHAFDAAAVKGKKVIVKTLPEGSKFTTLDEVERSLLDSDLMICNEEEGMCIAGVFGGIHSGVTEKTTSIFLEAACFDPVYVRKTARHHVLNTDASFRFERGSDPNLTIWALKRAALLIREMAGGDVSSEIVDIYPEPVEDFRVELLYSNIDRLIGMHLEPDTLAEILESLDIHVKFRNDQGMLVHVPPYRVDVQREADVIEEILRIYGFNRVETGTSLQSTLSYPEKPDKEKVTNRVADLLTARGFYEMKSNSLTKAGYHEKDGEEDPGAVRLFNPLSQDLAHMRKNLLFGGLEAIAYNLNRKNSDLKLYEFGFCYFNDPESKGKDLLDRFTETEGLGIFISGHSVKANWMQRALPASFASIKAQVESVLQACGIDPFSMETRGSDHAHLSHGLALRSGNKVLVDYGQVHKSLLKQFDIKQEVFAAEFNWDLLMKEVAAQRILFTPLPRFQVVTRDFSLLLDRKVQYEALRSLAFKTEGKLLRKVELFDVYEGDKIEEGKKSYALSFTLLDDNKTLTDKQIDKVMMKLARSFERELGAQVRGLNA